MKKNVSMTLAVLLLALIMLTGCSGGKTTGADASAAPADTSSGFDVSAAKTMGDVLAVEADSYGRTFGEDKLVYGIQIGDQAYRFIADLPADVADQLWNLEYDDEDYEQKVNDLISPLEITETIDLSEGIPTQEEVDAYVGKTGGDLLNEGWHWDYYDLSTMEFGMTHGAYCYRVVFDSTETYENDDDFDADAVISTLPIKEIEYTGFGDVAYMDE